MSADALGRRAERELRRESTDLVPNPGSIGVRSLPPMVAPDVPPLVPAGGVFEGEVTVVADTRIEGRVEGSLKGAGRVVLGPEACVQGVLECDEVDSEGTIRGPIVARRHVRLGPGAQLEGDIQAPTVEVCETAVWNGLARVGERRSEDPGSG